MRTPNRVWDVKAGYEVVERIVPRGSKRSVQVSWELLVVLRHV